MTLRIQAGATGVDSKVTIVETGQDVAKLIAMTRIAVDITSGLTKVQIEAGLFGGPGDGIEVIAERAEFVTKHPISGEIVPVRAIDFDDGVRVDFAEGVPVAGGWPQVRHNDDSSGWTSRSRAELLAYLDTFIVSRFRSSERWAKLATEHEAKTGPNAGAMSREIASQQRAIFTALQDMRRAFVGEKLIMAVAVDLATGKTIDPVHPVGGSPAVGARANEVALPPDDGSPGVTGVAGEGAAGFTIVADGGRIHLSTNSPAGADQLPGALDKL